MSWPSDTLLSGGTSSSQTPRVFRFDRSTKSEFAYNAWNVQLCKIEHIVSEGTIAHTNVCRRFIYLQKRLRTGGTRQSELCLWEDSDTMKVQAKENPTGITWGASSRHEFHSIFPKSNPKEESPYKQDSSRRSSNTFDQDTEKNIHNRRLCFTSMAWTGFGPPLVKLWLDSRFMSVSIQLCFEIASCCIWMNSYSWCSWSRISN
jgi:hypothetical protein